MNKTAVRGGGSAPSRESTVMAGDGEFAYYAGRPLRSSGAKVLQRGTFKGADGMQTDALLVVFGRNSLASYAREIATLAKAQAMGVGPRLLCPYVELPTGRVAFVEEDVGVSLEVALSGAGIPYDDGRDPVPLHPVGSDERMLEAKKVMFDVLVQMDGLHEHGIYHRDLRAANVCVRRFGNSPQDLRATLVDFDLSAQGTAGSISYDNQPYVHLFETLPQSLGLREGVVPTALEIDMGYLAALNWEATMGRPIEEATAQAFVAAQGEWPLFGYHDGPNPYFARRVSEELDINVLAHELGLTPVGDDAFPEPATLLLARQMRHGGYVDACDLARIRAEHPEGAVYGAVEELSRKSYATYLSQVVNNGLQVSYKSFEGQPSALVESTKAQVRDIPNKVFALGLRIVDRDDLDSDGLVTEFSADEVEYLAFLEHKRWCAERRACGWTYGPTKCVERRVSNALVPYDELSEANKEYNRAHVREIPSLLKSVGLGIARRRRIAGRKADS